MDRRHTVSLSSVHYFASLQSKTFEYFHIARRVMMTRSRFIETILALAEDTSLADDEALDLLARSLLSALILDP